jgi:hypothetical protein
MQSNSIFSKDTYIYKSTFLEICVLVSDINKFAYSYHTICKNTFVQKIKIEIT